MNSINDLDEESDEEWRKEIYVEVEDRNMYMTYIKENPGILVFKFGADWCGPCKQIEDDLEQHFANTPDNVICFDLNVDQCVDVYSFLKQRKQINGIPAILAYFKGNESFAPNLSHVGSNKVELKNFFDKINHYAEQL